MFLVEYLSLFLSFEKHSDLYRVYSMFTNVLFHGFVLRSCVQQFLRVASTTRSSQWLFLAPRNRLNPN